MANPDDFIKYDGNVDTGFNSSQDMSFYDPIEQGRIQSREEQSLDVVKYGVPSAIVGFIDTVGTSIGLLDDDQMKQSLEETLPQFGAYYKENEGGAKLAGDFAGMFIPGTIAIKMMQGTGRLFAGMNSTNKLSKLAPVFTSGKTYEQLMRGVKLRDKHLLKLGIDPALDQTRKAFTNSTMLTKVGDSIKEAAAFELGVYGVMNDSQVLYPDELSTMEIIGMNSALMIPFVGMEAAFMSRQMRASAQQAAEFFAEGGVRNPEGLLQDLLARPGMRDIQMTVEARSANVMRTMDQEYLLKETAGFEGKPIKFDAAKEQLNRQILALDTSIKTRAEEIFRDSPVKGLTNRSDPANTELETVLNALKMNDGALIGTYSLEHLPPSFKGIQEVFEKQKNVGSKLRDQIDKARIKQQELLAKGEDDAAELTKIESLTKQLDLVNGTEFYVIEPSGNIVNAAMRKPIYQDGVQSIVKKPRTLSSSAVFEVHTRGDDLFQTSDKLLGVTEDLHLVLPQDVEFKISGINVTKVIDPKELERIVKDRDYSLLLRDIGEDWHFLSGKRGNKVFNQLPYDVQTEIHNWIGSSGSSKLREWAEAGDPRYNQIVNAYREAGLHKRLSELADADGTIPLYRGEKAYKPGELPREDIVSYTSHPKIAGSFGDSSFRNKQVIAKRIHIDDIIMVVGGSGNEFEFIAKGNKLREIGETVTRRDWGALTLQERSAAYAGMQRAIDSYRPGSFEGERKVIFTGDHHTRIDAFLQLHQKHGDAVFKDFILGKGATIEDLNFAALEGKYKDFVGISKMRDAYKSGVLKIPDEKRLNFEDMRKMLNLPESNYGEVSDMLKFFEDIYRQGDVSLTESFKNIDDFNKAMQQSIAFPDRLPVLKTGELRSYGDMMAYPKDARPIMAMKRPASGFDYNRDYIIEQLGMMRAEALGKFARSRDEGAELVQTFYDVVSTRPELVEEAIRVQSLTQAGTRGTGAILQQSFAVGEQPAIQAMHNLAIIADREFRNKVGKIFEQYAPVFREIKHPNNKADMISFNTFTHARRMGWDLEDEAVAIAGPKGQLYQFKLKDTKFNRERWKALFGSDMPEEAMMPTTVSARDGKGLQPKTLAITELALRNAEAYSGLGEVILNNSNQINNIMQKPLRRKKEWWVPPKNLSKQHTGFLVDSSGRLHSVVDGRSPAEALRRAEQAKSVSDIPLIYVTRTDLGRYYQLRDEALERMSDFSDIGLQTGRAKGTSVTPEIIEVGEAAFNDMVTTVEKGFESILRRSRAAFFEPQIKMAYKMHQFAGLEEASKKGQTIWQRYLAEIFDNPTLNPNDVIGKTYYAAESIWDDLAQSAYDKVMNTVNPAGLKKIKANRSNNAAFQQLENQLGEFNPFTDAVNYVNRTYKQPIPTAMKPFMAKLTSLTTLLTLRMFEVGHSILTVTSLGATIPAVVKAMTKLDYETPRQFQARIGAFGIQVGEDTAMFSPTRAIMTTFHDWFNEPGFREAMDRAGKRGFFDQQVSEIYKTLTAPSEGYYLGLIRKHTDFVSKLSDNSEVFARGASFAVGYNIARKTLNTESEEALFTFANHFANQVIGDYSPNNKPRMFQGAAGMPTGLFMTFMWNYYQRLFSYMENKQLGALAAQYATQASVFGAQTVPGFDLYANTFLSNYDGSINPVDGLQNRFGPEATEWLLYGSISNMPKIFGMDDGIALYTRGDVNFRNIPTIFTLSDTPTIAMISDAWKAGSETFKQIREREGFSPYQFSEVVQSYSTNRFMRNAASFLTGYTTDRRGQVISSTPKITDVASWNVNDYYKAATRLTGFRTMNEAQTVEAHYRIKSGELSRRYRMDALRDTVRSDIRAGNFDGDKLTNAVSSYIRYGGSPQYFANWVADQFVAGSVDKNAREIMRLMKDDRRAQDVQRLVNILVPGEYQ